MYIKCKQCGKEFYLAKYYPSTGWFTHQNIEKDKLNEWLDRHWNEEDHDWIEQTFEMSYEVEEDGKEKHG